MAPFLITILVSMTFLAFAQSMPQRSSKDEDEIDPGKCSKIEFDEFLGEQVRKYFFFNLKFLYAS